MTVQVRTFRIRNSAAGSSAPETGGADDERAVSAFLRAVEVDRVETAYAEGAWHLLVLYRDRKDQEEAAQIASAVAAALRDWRALAAAREGLPATALLSDALLEKVALAVPTTTIELAELQDGDRRDPGPFATEIVQVVRHALAELT
ncbi:MAG: aldolase [Alphaproteobacteria bacterium]|jgi:ribonuclease D|nr:aldolase [Alphaproteobacteria bacterium]